MLSLIVFIVVDVIIVVVIVCCIVRWVIVHGIPGFGKTVLAAEAVRDATILKEVFPGESDRNGNMKSLFA